MLCYGEEFEIGAIPCQPTATCIVWPIVEIPVQELPPCVTNVRRRHIPSIANISECTVIQVVTKDYARGMILLYLVTYSNLLLL